MKNSDCGAVRILQVVGGMNRAGIETWLMHMLRNIDRKRFQMDFVVHHPETYAYEPEIRELGCRVSRCMSPERPWQYARNLRRILDQHGPYDIVHSQLYLYNGLVLRVAASAGTPVRISHVHPYEDQKPDGWLRAGYRKWMLHWMSKYATCTMAPSETSLLAIRDVCDVSRHVQQLVPNCLDLSAFAQPVDRAAVRRSYALPLDYPVAVCVARFCQHKNHAQIFRLADRLNRNGKRIHFVLAGSHGEELESIRDLCRNRKDVSVLTGIPNIAPLMCAGDLFVFPSLNEGFGIVVIEAAAAGLPVIATDLPSIREACPPAHLPLLFPPNDDAAACERIDRVLEDRELRQRLSEEAKRWADRFSIARSLESLMRVYEPSGIAP
jgi:glycosyltransferase involved in cell wall biosynthesis